MEKSKQPKNIGSTQRTPTTSHPAAHPKSHPFNRPTSTRTAHQPLRRRDWSGLSAIDTLARYKPGKADPVQVLEVLLRLFNDRHTARDKSVSHKTRQERADFLRRFFRDLTARAGFKTLPDPRNLGQKHVHAMVQVWRQDKLKPATIQTYLSFLRGLAKWMGKNGFIRSPAHYGLELEEYQRHEATERDKSWSAQDIDIDAVIDKVCAYDRYVGASLRLIRALGLRRKEAVMLRPHLRVMPFKATGLPEEEQQAGWYVWISQGAKNGRARGIPLNTPQRLAAIEFAQDVVSGLDSHMGDPKHDLRHNLQRFSYVLSRFKLTAKEFGVTGHGLRHEALIDEFAAVTGVQPPVRGGAALPVDVELRGRLAVSRLAGHVRPRAASAYLGQSVVMRSKPQQGPTGTGS